MSGAWWAASIRRPCSHALCKAEFGLGDPRWVAIPKGKARAQERKKERERECVCDVHIGMSKTEWVMQNDMI